MATLPPEWLGYYDTATLNFRPGTVTAPYAPAKYAPRFGWRFWHLREGVLWPPFAVLEGSFADLYGFCAKPLPPTGLAIAECPFGGEPAALDCDCGVCFWPDVGDMYRAVRLFRISGNPGVVVTFGAVTGPVSPDPNMKGLDMRDAFRGYRAGAYFVLAAIVEISAVHQLGGYRMPVRTYQPGSYADLHGVQRKYANKEAVLLQARMAAV